MAIGTMHLPVLGPMAAVLDACAMIAYLRGEPGADVVASILSNPANVCYAHAVNLAEVYYYFLNMADQTRAENAIRDLATDYVHFRDDMDPTFWKSVASLKAAHGIALGDCFCLALAQRIGGEIVTSDHGEFDPLVSLGLCPINFIR